MEAALTDPLVAEQYRSDEAGATLIHQTRRSGLRVAAAMDHEVHGPEGVKITSEATEDIGRTTVIARLKPGETLRLDQVPGLRLVVAPLAARAARPGAGRAGRRPLHRLGRACSPSSAQYLDEFWATADVEIDGDAELQQAVRLATFHVLQAGARAERRAIGAKGLTGEGYDGHTFWDTETFCLPVLSHLAPEAAADALRWRQSILPLAYERAEQLGLQGRGVPVADDPRPGVLRVLAGRHGGVPHQRRHRRRRAPARGGHRRRRVRARGRAGAAGGHRAAVALAGPPRRRRASSASTG